ncbi:MAG: glycosyltransferase family 4 protein [Chloroflexota bacterium]
MSTHIGINAHLLSASASYRAAGIHGYIFNTLAHLANAAPADWRFTAMVGAGIRHQFDGMTMRRARADTAWPLRRIVWEQLAQPWQVGGFDLLHAMAFVSPLVLRRPSVVTVYDLSFHHYPQVLSPARRLYLRLFTALSCRRARRVIAISESTARDLTATLGIPPDRIDTAPPGYDVDRFRPLPAADVTAFRAQQGLPERFWLFLGTLEPRKNLVTLIDAYAALPQAERLPLILAGGKGWDYQAVFGRIAQHQLGDQVRSVGFVPAEDLPLWYNSAETLVYPSIFEGFGLPVLEAMACGTPVVISNASSLPEVAGESGLLVPPHDVAAWTAALHQASTDATWRAHAAARGQREVERYSWAHTACITVTSYQRALKRESLEVKHAADADA